MSQLPSAEQVTSFGINLRVSGKDGAALLSQLQNFIAGKPLLLNAVETSLEDAFIHLMQNSQNNLRYQQEWLFFQSLVRHFDQRVYSTKT